MKKRCIKCIKDKFLKEFSKNPTQKDGLQRYCKECKKIVDNNYIINNKEKINSKQIERSKKIKAKCNNFKSNFSCLKCNENRFYLLDFHHINPEDKITQVSAIIGSESKNWEKAFDEIKKCILLCSNCHREFHYLQKENNIKLEDYINKDIILKQNEIIISHLNFI